MGPMHHRTDRKIRIHAFYCMLGISLLQYIHKQSQAAWNGCPLSFATPATSARTSGVISPQPFLKLPRQMGRSDIGRRRSGMNHP